MLEAEICRRLEKGQSPNQVAQEVAESAYTKSKADLFCFQNFLYQSGQYQLLLNLIKYSIKEGRPFSQNLLLLLLEQKGLASDFSTSMALIKSASEQKQLSQLSQVPDGPGIPSEVLSAKANFLKGIQSEYNTDKEHLFEKLEFLNVEGIIEEEHKVLQELELRYPFDSRLAELRGDFDQKWAHYLLSQKPKLEDTLDDDYALLALPEEQAETLKIIYQEAAQFVELKSLTGYNLSIMFYFMGQFNEALNILEKTPASYSVDWLKLELFIQTRRFIEAISWSKTLEKKYSDDPETTFSAIYSQAICLWGLKRSAQAIEMMESLINVRSDYRSAKSLFTKWSRGQR